MTIDDLDMRTFTHPLSKAQRMTYRIGRGETLVLTFEPYKSEILPFWRFKTPPIARKSSKDIWNKFIQYHEDGDFVGMDMSRKFLQMGMTRAKRYANHKGGRKYERQKGVSGEEGRGKELEKCKMGEKEKEKLECSLIFKEVWEKAKTHEGYLSLKEEFQKEQKEWDKEQKMMKKKKEEDEVEVKDEDEASVKQEEGEHKAKKSTRTTRMKIKNEVKEEDLSD
jgi:hypothetical protein